MAFPCAVVVAAAFAWSQSYHHRHRCHHHHAAPQQSWGLAVASLRPGKPLPAIQVAEEPPLATPEEVVGVAVEP